ncbi:hypothetical protein [Streptomyces nodosus]
MINDLDSIDGSSMRHAYGPAVDRPAATFTADPFVAAAAVHN